MIYAKKLPAVRELLGLSQYVQFPAQCIEIIELANGLDLSQDVIDFLEIFPARETFSSRVDFMTRCEELELLIGQEREAPAEVLRSP